ncbi:MAG TPA: aspartate/glutamate racemase family protein [Candidatus Saccharimonadales bacterium]|jgi:glutamate racemase
MKIGVFDSGIGGEAIAATIRAAFPDATVQTVNDRAHLPYGSRPPAEIVRLTDAAIQPLLASDCDVIVLACNSATAAAIEPLRLTYPEQQFVGLEPMVKPAAQQTTSRVVAVCATPATLASDRYRTLKEIYAQNIVVLEPDCRDWATMIEQQQLDELIIKNEINDLLLQDVDVIVLACTHYHWIRELIESLVDGKASVLDPSQAIVERIKSLQ